ncbi:hypothetical protein KL867_05180 [Ruegeria litorea]|uniref:Uncharacterized protein n=1 Tax=Falsiruegeria litorea TaxID=1280831 RepID=A0ABS5WN35_9RHOB|nr:hypothetical protein [Falsiruegeria litorea]MBT3140432.1 hypothetical protein [Falsiruegeria litorea]
MELNKLQLKKACDDLANYCVRILCPATDELFRDLEDNEVSLHQAFGVNMFAAHAIDYLHAIREARGDNISRSDLLKQFDALFSEEDAVLANRKFQLVNSINNSLKHIELDAKRTANAAVLEHYGPIRIGALVEREGRIYCNLDNYWFDFCRVVLRPILEEFRSIDFTDQDVIEGFASGEVLAVEAHAIDHDDPIDEMIEFCNPPCLNCGESEDECECRTFVFDKKGGHFEPIQSNPDFNFDRVMSQISGAY